MVTTPESYSKGMKQTGRERKREREMDRERERKHSESAQ